MQPSAPPHLKDRSFVRISHLKLLLACKIAGKGLIGIVQMVLRSRILPEDIAGLRLHMGSAHDEIWVSWSLRGMCEVCVGCV